MCAPRLASGQGLLQEDQDNTPSIASIIPDAADDAMLAGDAREPENDNKKKLLETMGNKDKLKRNEGMCTGTKKN